ncbi:MAG: ABC transporter permease, partial [Chloroflexota bacterium]
MLDKIRYKRLFRSNEFVIFLILLGLSLTIGIINPAFFTVSTLFDTLRSSIVFLILAYGLLPIVIAGGIDISFVAIAATTSYATHMFLLNQGYEGGVFLYYLIAGVAGIFAGLLNAFLVTRFKLPIFDVSLAMFTMWYGFNLFFVGATANFSLPKGTVGFYNIFILTAQDPNVGETGLHVSVLLALGLGLFVWWFLKYTTLGRGVYAIGGNREVAIRSGFSIQSIFFVIFGMMGIFSAIAGVTQAFLSRYFNPVIFITQPLDVLAAIILGGAAITG